MRNLLATVLGLAISLAFVAGASANDENLYGSIHFGFAKATGDGAPNGSTGFCGSVFLLDWGVFGFGGEFGYYQLGKINDPRLEAIQPPDALPPDLFAVRVRTLQTTANFLLQPRGNTFRPYLTGGLGAYPIWLTSTLGDFVSTNTTTRVQFGWNGGAGIVMDVFRDSPVNFNLEGRWHQVLFDETSPIDFFMVSIGLGVDSY